MQRISQMQCSEGLNYVLQKCFNTGFWVNIPNAPRWQMLSLFSVTIYVQQNKWTQIVPTRTRFFSVWDSNDSDERSKNIFLPLPSSSYLFFSLSLLLFPGDKKNEFKWSWQLLQFCCDGSLPTLFLSSCDDEWVCENKSKLGTLINTPQHELGWPYRHFYSCKEMHEKPLCNNNSEWSI